MLLPVALVATVGTALGRIPDLERLGWRLRRAVTPTPPVTPDGRPIEEIADCARRLAHAFYLPSPGQRFAKYEAVRRAYDEVLGEACHALDIDDEFLRLRPGRERDLGRGRVEFLLGEAGLRLPVPDR